MRERGDDVEAGPFRLMSEDASDGKVVEGEVHGVSF